ncbi:MAG: TIGR00153 family protein [Chlamydiae bacterium]|nr:TIGR00153 family protein [Chlamydiota bacterium]
MLTIARLFGKSPFAPLQTHMQKVASCIDKLSTIFDKLPGISLDQIEALVNELAKLEHEADLTKNDIRNHLPKSLFLPIDRSQFLEILALQDSIADKTEDVGLLLHLRQLEFFDHMLEDIKIFYKKNVEVFEFSRKIIQEIDELLESSFGGIEAEKVKTMVEITAAKEHDADRMQRALTKKLFASSSQLSTPGFYQWVKLIEEIGLISSLSEKLANRIRMILELK